MAGIHLPSEEEEQYWIHAQGDRQDYFEAHDVLRPKDTTANDVPESDNEAVQELDEETLQQDSPTSLTGKWNVFLKPAEIDGVWDCVTGLSKRTRSTLQRYRRNMVANKKIEITMSSSSTRPTTSTKTMSFESANYCEISAG